MHSTLCPILSCILLKWPDSNTINNRPPHPDTKSDHDSPRSIRHSTIPSTHLPRPLCSSTIRSSRSYHSMATESQKTSIRDAYSPITKRFHCSFHGCTKQFIRKEHLSRHLKSHNPSLEHRCYVCGRGYARRYVSLLFSS